VILFSAGHETTASSITSGLHFLLEHPLEFEKLRNDPEGCLPTFIEEVFRYESAATRGIRLPKAALVIRGQLIKAGQPVVLLLNAANHDPEQFTDPHIFNIKRSPNEHLAFGSGRHICIGAPLARIEMDAAFRAILKIMPRPRLADAVVGWRPVMGIRSIERLPVHAGP
jgi:cytochrome P450